MYVIPPPDPDMRPLLNCTAPGTFIVAAARLNLRMSVASEAGVKCPLTFASPGLVLSAVLEPCYDSYGPGIALAGARMVPVLDAQAEAGEEALCGLSLTQEIGPRVEVDVLSTPGDEGEVLRLQPREKRVP